MKATTYKKFHVKVRSGDASELDRFHYRAQGKVHVP